MSSRFLALNATSVVAILTFACPAEAAVLTGTTESGATIFFQVSSIRVPGEPFNASYTLSFDRPVTDFFGITQTRYSYDENPGFITRSIFRLINRIDDRSFRVDAPGFVIGEIIPGTGTIIGTEPTSGSFRPTFATPGPVDYRLDITPVPEPATWAMMIGGFGLMGGTLRRLAVKVSYTSA